MNNTFSLRRVLLYGHKHYIENARNYLYGLLVFLILQSAAAWICGVWYKDSGSYSLTTLFIMIGFTYFVTCLSCRSHYDPQQMPLAYTLPITSLEKYLFIWFNSAIAATVVFGIMQWPATTIFSLGNLQTESIINFMPYPTWSLLYLIQAGALLACCWTKKNPLKILIPLAVAFILFYFMYYYGLHNIDNLNVRIPFSEIHMHMYSDKAAVASRLPVLLSENWAHTVIFGFWVLTFWLAGYFKFKERTLK